MHKASVRLDVARVIGDVNRRLFGSFVEHLGRCVYDGIYEPSHPLADTDGFRTDVLELVKELGVTTIRYPGGNFVSGYRWEDGVGPRENRPRRLDLAWHSTETNAFGLDEFAAWSAKAGTEMMMAVNLGTRGVLEALDVLEYSNIAGGTAYSEQRKLNGATEPYAITMWCLGNEMDGPWQLGHSSAEEYGAIAAKTAKAMRQLDERIELVVCGSSSAQMPTFGEWERVVLEHTYEDVDYISCHAYYEEVDGDRDSFLASAINMDRFIEAVVASADHVKALKRSEKTINISFDEWNVWYQQRYRTVDKITGIENWPEAPRLLEDNYSVVDAVVFGSLLISLVNHSDRVTSASLAQLVNVIAPIMTEPGGPTWRQTTFYPFATTARLARGIAIDLTIEASTLPTNTYGTVPVIDAAATWDESAGEISVFLVNRSQTQIVTVSIELDRNGRVSEAVMLSDDDHDARNTLQDPNRVQLQPNTTASLVDRTLTIDLPPVSWTAVTVTTAAAGDM